MQLGKREQLTLAGIVTLVVIGLIHFVLFAPAIKRYRDSKSVYDQMVTEIKGYKTADNNQLTSLTKTTQANIGVLTSGTQILQLKEDPTFIPIETFMENKRKELRAEPQYASMPQEEFDKVQGALVGGSIMRWIDMQTTMMLAQVEQLQSYGGSQAPRMSFMAPSPPNARGVTSWNIPTALPPQMQTGQLWDVIKVIEERKGTLKAVTKNSASYNTLLNQYNGYLAQIGLNVNTARSLERFGEFVPMYYRLSVLQLVLKQMPKDRPIIIHESELTLARLRDLLEIKIDTDPGSPGMTVNKTYFAYESLRQINTLLAMSKEFQITDVTNITLYPFGLLRQQAEFKMASADIVDPRMLTDDQVYHGGGTAAPADAAAGAAGLMPGMLPGMMPGMMMPGMMPPGAMPGGAPAGEGGAPAGEDAGGAAPGGPPGAMMPGMMMPGMMPGMMGGGRFANAQPGETAVAGTPGKPQEGEIGLAMPIRISVQADNMKAWNFMYAVLQRQPLVEMNRLAIRALSLQDPNNTNIEATVTYIFVPKLFETIDAVQRVLQDIQSGTTQPDGSGSPTAAAPGGPPGMMPPGMPVPGAPGAPPVGPPGLMPPGAPVPGAPPTQ